MTLIIISTTEEETKIAQARAHGPELLDFLRTIERELKENAKNAFTPSAYESTLLGLASDITNKINEIEGGTG